MGRNPCLQSPVGVSSTVAGLVRHALGVRRRMPMPKPVGVGYRCHLAAMSHQIRSHGRTARSHPAAAAWWADTPGPPSHVPASGNGHGSSVGSIETPVGGECHHG